MKAAILIAAGFLIAGSEGQYFPIVNFLGVALLFAGLASARLIK